MSDTCLNCGGLIPEPNKAYGYAGKVCFCPIHLDSLYQKPSKKVYGIRNPKPEPTRFEVIINSSCKNCGEKWIDTMKLTLAQPRGQATDMEWDYCSECYHEHNAYNKEKDET